jgi:hypothetical protein
VQPLERGHDIARRRHHATGPAVEGDRRPVPDREADILEHLAGRELDDEHASRARGGLRQRGVRERPQRDRPEEAGAQAGGTSALDGRPGDPGRGAVGHDDELGVVEPLAGPADLARLDGAVLDLEVVVVGLERLGLEVE